MIISPVLAQTNPSRSYTPLAPLPLATNSSGPTTLSTYLPNLFKLLIGSGAVLAFLFIFWYGFEYMFSDSLISKGKARERITEVLGGLILIICSYAILYNINPRTLNMSLALNKPKVVGNSVELTAVSVDGVTDESTARKLLADSKIGINAGPCSGTQTKGCTNVSGLPVDSINTLSSLKSGCNCDVVITGGTEGGHQTHGQSIPIVDLSPTTSLNNFLGATNPKEGQVVTKSINGKNVVFTYETAGGNASGTSTGNHWHVKIN